MAVSVACAARRLLSSRVGVAHVFRSRALPRSEALELLDANEMRVFAVTRSARAAEVLFHLSQTRSRTAILLLPKRLANEFVDSDADETVPLTPAMLHAPASRLGDAVPTASDASSSCLVEVGRTTIQEGLGGSFNRPRWLSPSESPDEPPLPPVGGEPTPIGFASAPESVAASATGLAVAKLGAAVLAASEAGAVETLLELLPAAGPASVPLSAASRHPSSGATPLHLLAIAAAATPQPGASSSVVAGPYGRTGALPPTSSGLPKTAVSQPLVSPLLVTAVRRLIASGVDVNAPAANGSTALHWAAGAGNVGMVRLLLDCGADPYLRSYTWRREVCGRGSGQTALHWAAESNHAAAVDALASAAPLLPVAVDERGRTPRDLALREGAAIAEVALTAFENEPLVALELSFDVSAFAHLPPSPGTLGTTRAAALLSPTGD